jgi:hypothetical protein
MPSSTRRTFAGQTSCLTKTKNSWQFTANYAIPNTYILYKMTDIIAENFEDPAIRHEYMETMKQKSLTSLILKAIYLQITEDFEENGSQTSINNNCRRDHDSEHDSEHDSDHDSEHDSDHDSEHDSNNSSEHDSNNSSDHESSHDSCSDHDSNNESSHDSCSNNGSEHDSNKYEEEIASRRYDKYGNIIDPSFFDDLDEEIPDDYELTDINFEDLFPGGRVLYTDFHIDDPHYVREEPSIQAVYLILFKGKYITYTLNIGSSGSGYYSVSSYFDDIYDFMENIEYYDDVGCDFQRLFDKYKKSYNKLTIGCDFFCEVYGRNGLRKYLEFSKDKYKNITKKAVTRNKINDFHPLLISITNALMDIGEVLLSPSFVKYQEKPYGPLIDDNEEYSALPWTGHALTIALDIYLVCVGLRSTYTDGKTLGDANKIASSMNKSLKSLHQYHVCVEATAEGIVYRNQFAGNVQADDGIVLKIGLKLDDKVTVVTSGSEKIYEGCRMLLGNIGEVIKV